jgi:hypothetical protein
MPWLSNPPNNIVQAVQSEEDGIEYRSKVEDTCLEVGGSKIEYTCLVLQGKALIS